MSEIRNGWLIEHLSGSAAQLHSSSVDQVGDRETTRRVRVLQADTPAVVLGSTQADSVVDPTALAESGFELARRRSGGGAVLVGAGRVLWVDLLVGRHDRLWSEDVRIAPLWVGHLWAAALGSVGVVGTEVTRTMQTNEWSRLVCFAGQGPGEVVVDGRKVVGVAQRRTRWGALFQCAAVLDGNPDPLLAVLDLDPRDRARASDSVGSATLGVGADLARPLAERLTAFLPGP